MRSKKIIILLGLFLFFLAFGLGMKALQRPFEALFLQKITREQGITIKQIPKLPDFLNPVRNWEVGELEVNSTVALAAEIDSKGNVKYLFRKLEKEKMPIASLTKLMTALVVLKDYDLSQRVKISKKAFNQKEDRGELKEGDVFSAKDLLYITLIESSNDAAFALSEIKGEKEFVDLMNLEAKKLALRNTYFSNPTGLDPTYSTTTPTATINYSTGEDLVKLIQHLLKNYPLVWEILSEKEYNLYTPKGDFHHKLETTNELLEEFPEIIGGKTGWTKRAGGCLISVLESPVNNKFLIILVLNSPNRFEETKKIINWTKKAYKWY